MEGERKEEKGRGRDARPGAGPPKIFGLEPPLARIGLNRFKVSGSIDG
jgi:hypothetical protein